jgi:hypothetical protein
VKVAAFSATDELTSDKTGKAGEAAIFFSERMLAWTI